MKLFDCNCSFGIFSLPFFSIAANASELIEIMDFCGIDKAMVYHSSMRFDTPLIGNKEILIAIGKSNNRLLPTWAILPSQTGEQQDPDIFLESMKKSGVKALWAFPNEHHYRLDKITFGNLFNLLIEQKIPLFVKDNAVNIGNLLASFPNLIVIAANQGPHPLDRYLRPLIEEYPNFYIETSYYIGGAAIESFCKRYGETRLLFGTAFPDNCKGGSVLQLAQADIPDFQKEAIAYKNLERIMKESKL